MAQRVIKHVVLSAICLSWFANGCAAQPPSARHRPCVPIPENADQVGTREYLAKFCVCEDGSLTVSCQTGAAVLGLDDEFRATAPAHQPARAFHLADVMLVPAINLHLEAWRRGKERWEEDGLVTLSSNTFQLESQGLIRSELNALTAWAAEHAEAAFWVTRVAALAELALTPRGNLAAYEAIAKSTLSEMQASWASIGLP